MREPDSNNGRVKTCPACSHESPSDANFCQHCGSRFHPVCTNCRAEMAPGARFCHQCGQPAPTAKRRDTALQDYTPRHLADKILTTRSALQGERKQVTVLFADVKGSMALAERVDMEDWHGILDDFFRILATGIHRFEGTINQYTGDGIMALFGAPIAHEDHAVRACCAALYLRDELRRHADRLRMERGLNFGVRIGLNSGEVVVGSIGDDLRMDYTAQGQTVGLAARMEHLAESGHVYITEHTRQLIRGFVTVRDLGTFTVKGVSRPLRVFELEAVRGYQGRLDISRQRGFSAFIGRNREMDLLHAALDRTLEGDGQVVGVVGEPGVGKSRLCFEFIESGRKRQADIFKSVCASHTRSIPLLPVIQLLRGIFGISERESRDDIRQKIAGRLVLLDDAFKDTLPTWFRIMAVADPQHPVFKAGVETHQQKLFTLIRRLVRSLSRHRPLVILMDDLHWIDPSSDIFIARLVDAVKGSRTLLLLNFRPEYRREWMNRDIYTEISLKALDNAGARDMLRNLLGRDPSVRNLFPDLAARALGNPFFIEELVRSLADAGNLAGRPTAYRLVKPVRARTLPDTVQALLAARIDRLGESPKQVLQTASVLGQEFEESTLRHAVELPDREIDYCLGKLNAVEFLYRKTFSPEPVFAFSHPIAREVAYQSLLSMQRARLHGRAARAMESMPAERLDEAAGLLAFHWEQAGEPENAARWHRRAAQVSGFAEIRRTFFHWHQVLKLARQIPANPDTRRSGIRKLELEACCATLEIGGRVDLTPGRVRNIFQRGRQLAEKLDDASSLLHLYENMAARLGWSGDLEGQDRYLNVAAEIAENVPDPEIRLNLLQRRYVALFHRGELVQALALAAAGIKSCAASESGLESGVFIRLSRTFWLDKANILLMMGELKQAAAAMDQASRLVQSDGPLRKGSRTSHSEALIRTNLSFYTGDSDTRMRDARNFSDLASRSGSVWARIISASALGRVHLTRRNWSRARELLEDALAQARQHELGLESEASILAFLADALSGCGETQDALDLAEEAIAVALRQKTRFWEIQAQISLAGALLGSSRNRDHVRIAEALERAEHLVEKTGGKVMMPFIMIRRAQLAGIRGDEAGRRRLSRQARELLVSMGGDDTPDWIY